MVVASALAATKVGRCRLNARGTKRVTQKRDNLRTNIAVNIILRRYTEAEAEMKLPDDYKLAVAAASNAAPVAASTAAAASAMAAFQAEAERLKEELSATVTSDTAVGGD